MFVWAASALLSALTDPRSLIKHSPAAVSEGGGCNTDLIAITYQANEATYDTIYLHGLKKKENPVLTYTCRYRHYMDFNAGLDFFFSGLFSKFNLIIYPQNLHIYSQMTSVSLKLTFSLGR